MRCVLVVEDHPELRMALAGALRERGFEVREVSDGQSAIEEVDRRAPDLICLDLVLPERSGYEVCEHIRAQPHLADAKVLVISGRAQALDRSFAFEAGADAFVSKPFLIGELLQQIDALLERSGSRPSFVAA